MNDKIINILDNLDEKETESLLHSHIETNIDKKTISRIKSKVYKKTGIKQRKNQLFKSLAAVLAMAIIAYIAFPVKYQVQFMDRYILARDVEELEDVSELIVIATVLPEKENVLVRNEGELYSRPKFGYTKMNLQIDEVIKGDGSQGDIIDAYEESWRYRKTIYTQENYRPTKVDKQYLFFLSKDGYRERYFPVDLQFGKYALKENILTNIKNIINISNEDLEIGDRPEPLDRSYRQWFKEVYERYELGDRKTEIPKVDVSINGQLISGFCCKKCFHDRI